MPNGGTPGVNARDRIGSGPWRNAKGVVIAQNLTELHGLNNLNKQTALTEKGEIVNGFGDTPNQHDILTGSQPDGTYIAGNVDTTCGNWTRSGEGAAMLGHSDRTGPNDSVPLEVVELRAPVARLQHRCAQGDRRRRPALLLRRELRPVALDLEARAHA